MLFVATINDFNHMPDNINWSSLPWITVYMLWAVRQFGSIIVLFYMWIL